MRNASSIKSRTQNPDNPSRNYQNINARCKRHGTVAGNYVCVYQPYSPTNQRINKSAAKSYATRAAANACHMSSESQLHKAGVIGVYLSGSLIGKLPVMLLNIYGFLNKKNQGFVNYVDVAKR